jgi:uncharacterized protein (TIGR02996 family)
VAFLLPFSQEPVMRPSEIKLRKHYTARVNRCWTTVRVDAIRPQANDRVLYEVTNVTTGRRTTFRSARKFQRPIDREEALHAAEQGKRERAIARREAKAGREPKARREPRSGWINKEQKALYQTILENRNDDAPRLVYADWLDDHGESDRAEFIRVQIELAHRSDQKSWRPSGSVLPHAIIQHEADPQYIALLRRQVLFQSPPRDLVGEWLKREAPSWMSSHATFRRGFVGEWDTTATSTFFKRAPIAFQKCPLEALTLGDVISDDVALFTKLPFLEGITELRIGGVADDKVATMIANCPRLSRLRTLCLPSPSAAGVRTLVTSAHLQHLASLDLGCGKSLGREGAKALALANLPDLQTLFLNSTGIGADGASVLAGAPVLKTIKTLALESCQLGTAGVRALVDSPLARAIALLDVANNDLDFEAINALVESPNLTSLRSLYLSFNWGIDDQSVERLADAPSLQSLWHVAVTGCGLTARGVDTLYRRFGKVTWNQDSR